MDVYSLCGSYFSGGVCAKDPNPARIITLLDRALITEDSPFPVCFVSILMLLWTWSKNRVKGKKYQMPKTMHQNNMVARGPKRLAGRYHQLKTPIPEVDEELGHGRVRVVSVQDADEGTPVQELRQVEAATEDNVGRHTEKDRKREEPVNCLRTSGALERSWTS